MNRIRGAIERFRQVATVARDNPVPTELQIAAAECALDASIPLGYIAFVTACANLTLEFWDVYRIGSDPRQPGQSENIVEVNLSLRTQYPRDFNSSLVAFHNNGLGDQVCFRTARGADRNAECRIFLWRHDCVAGSNADQVIQVAESFGDWLGGELESVV